MDIISYGAVKKIQKIIDAAKGIYSSLKLRLDAMESNINNKITITEQVTLLNITASIETPYVKEITIPETLDFKRAPIEVLKFIPGINNNIITVSDFDAGDESLFTPNEYLIFDDTLHFKTQETYPMINEGTLGMGKLFSYTLDKTKYNIKSINVE